MCAAACAHFLKLTYVTTRFATGEINIVLHPLYKSFNIMCCERINRFLCGPPLTIKPACYALFALAVLMSLSCVVLGAMSFDFDTVIKYPFAGSLFCVALGLLMFFFGRTEDIEYIE